MVYLDWSELKEQGGPKYKQKFVDMAFSKFPDFKERYDSAIKLHANNKLVHEKFNGDIVSSFTGLTGKPLGCFIARLKSEFETEQAFKDWVLKSSEHEINNLLKEQYIKQNVPPTIRQWTYHSQ